MEAQKLEKSTNSLNRLSQAVEELIGVIHKQRQDFQAALDAEKNNTVAANQKVATLEQQVQSLQSAKEKLAADLNAAQDNTESEAKIKELENLADSRAEKIDGLQAEVQKLNAVLANQKAQIEENEKQKYALEQQLTETKNKVTALEQAQASGSSAITDLQNRLDAALSEKDELKQKIEQMQQTITQTTDDIDSVVARLEKVLQENGASNNNN
jgi:chromosome segregation ATPase